MLDDVRVYASSVALPMQQYKNAVGEGRWAGVGNGCGISVGFEMALKRGGIVHMTPYIYLRY